MTKRIYIRGNAQRSAEIIAELIKRGGKTNITGTRPDHLYYIGNNGMIAGSIEGTTLYDMLIEFGQEIYLEPEYRYDIGDTVKTSDGAVRTVLGRVNYKGNPHYRLCGESPSYYFPQDSLSPYSEGTTQAEPEPQFQPYEKVLVRNDVTDVWRASIFSHVNPKEDAYYKYICVGNIYSQCIPYEGNEHLLGTTDEPRLI